MCGILAILVKNTNSMDIDEKFREILSYMKHRGPDAVKAESYELKYQKHQKLMLGHHRLAILDLSDAGVQPMTSDDGRYTIIFNGEIYNYIELREELIRGGESFDTDTDTEVLLSGFKLHGVNFLKQLNGMFVFIIWDREEESLIAVRDRFGIKPLYYSEYEDKLILSSEIKPILEMRKQDVNPHEGVVWDYLAYGAVDRTNETFFKEIKRFPAGYYANISSNHEIVFHQYWELEKEVKELQEKNLFQNRNYNDHKGVVRELFTQAVKLRLRSDVTVGSCLSGGIDSSAIVGTVSELLPPDKREIFQTFSFIIDENSPLSEKKFVDIVTQATNTDNYTTTPSIDEVNSHFEKYMWHQEEPTTTISPFGQYNVMKLASENGVTVLLDGQGADEILAGYFPLTAYYFYELFTKLRWITLVKEIRASKYRKSVKSFVAQLLPRILHQKLVKREKGGIKYLQEKFIERNKSRPLPTLLLRRKKLNQALAISLQNNFQHLLRYEDRNSMAFSIEARVPFLDHNLVKYLLALPPKYIIKNGVTKWIFREAMNGIVAHEILQRRDKIGFAMPEAYWLQEKDPHFIDQLEKEQHSMIPSFITKNALEELVKNRKKLSLQDLRFLYRISCLNTWANIFFKK